MAMRKLFFRSRLHKIVNMAAVITVLQFMLQGAEPYCCGAEGGRAEEEALRDLYSDTWVATDALGRTLSGRAQCRASRSDRFVGIFYWTWHHTNHKGPYDVTRIVSESKKTGKPPRWGPVHAAHHWGEPELGYYVMNDPYVIRKHASMLSDAGVDVIIFDTTNPPFTFREQYTALCTTYLKIREKGGRTPQIAFLAPFWNSGGTVKQLFAELYSKGLYKELWFLWDGKPLIMAAPADVKDSPEIAAFFTFRKPIPSYFTGPSGPDQWGWLEVYPQHVFRDSAGNQEQVTVGVSQNAVGAELSMMSHKSGAMGRSWHNGKKDMSADAVHHGFNFSEQWKRALSVDPEFVFVTGWNEWIAGRFLKWYKYTAEKDSCFPDALFVDQFNHEYSRDIEPMKGGHTDSYYYQFVSYVRRYKGVRDLPKACRAKTIQIDGLFSEWRDVVPEFRDTRGDTAHREFRGYGETHYTNTTGRNDFLVLKVACDAEKVFFYAKTAQPLTPATGANWMLLFIDADQDKQTGWEGYDLLLNHTMLDSRTSEVRFSRNGWNWEKAGTAAFRAAGNELELALPRGLFTAAAHDENKTAAESGGAAPISFDFHWADNIQKPGDIIEFSTSGDSAPNRRFDYRYQFVPQAPPKPDVPSMLRRYYQSMTKPKPLKVLRGETWKTHRMRIRRKLLADCGLSPLPPRPPLSVKRSKPLAHPWCTVRRIYYRIWPDVYANGLLFMPKQLDRKPAPAVLCPHGHWTGGNSHPVVQKRLLVLAKKGYVVFSPQQNHYEDLPLGISHQTVGIWSNMRAVDFLQTLPEVDDGMIGCCGCSGGGLQTQMLTALDPRIKASVIAGYTCESREIMFIKGNHCGCNHFPGYMKYTDHPEISALGFPVPILYLTMNDWTRHFRTRNFPAVEKLYAENGFPGQAACSYEPTQHTYDRSKREKTYRWMDRWLRGIEAEEPDGEPESIETFPPEVLTALQVEVPGDTGFSGISDCYSGGTKWTDNPFAMKEALRELLGEGAVLPVSEVAEVSKPSAFTDGVCLQHALYPTEGGIRVPAVILRPAEMPEKLNVMIACDGRGKEVLLSQAERGFLVDYVCKGGLVALPDVRFSGVFSKGFLAKHDIGMWDRNAIVWGRPLPAMTCTDIRGVVNGIKSDFAVESVKLVCRNSKLLSVGGLFAALLDERITEADVGLEGCSFRDKGMPCVPGILRYGDVLKWKELLRRKQEKS